MSGLWPWHIIEPETVERIQEAPMSGGLWPWNVDPVNAGMIELAKRIGELEAQVKANEEVLDKLIGITQDLTDRELKMQGILQQFIDMFPVKEHKPEHSKAFYVEVPGGENAV